MLGHELFFLFTGPLEDLGLNYLVTGSVASIFYGEPRLTHDIDIVLELSLADAARIEKAFPLDQFYCPPVEVIRLEATRGHRGHFNLIHHETGFKADIYLMGQQPLHGWAMKRGRTVELSGQKMRVAPPEYVIIRKLEYLREGGSDKHIRDIRGMLAMTDKSIDQEAILEWVRRMQLETEWQLVSEKADDAF